jgi:coenzyme F420-reducing hydrogenase beta subunit
MHQCISARHKINICWQMCSVDGNADTSTGSVIAEQSQNTLFVIAKKRCTQRLSAITVFLSMLKQPLKI